MILLRSEWGLLHDATNGVRAGIGLATTGSRSAQSLVNSFSSYFLHAFYPRSPQAQHQDQTICLFLCFCLR